VSDRTLRTALVAVAVAGLLLSTYLTWVRFDESALVCATGGGCETVQQSRHAELAGVPVAILGLVFYAAVLVLAVWDSATARTLCAALAIGGLGFSGYLVALQLFVIDAVCVWCLVNDLVLVPAVAALTLARVRTSAPDAGSSA
jgi:uncharacterized membrane protein